MEIAITGSGATASQQVGAVTGSRLLHLEALRILAILFVLFNHTGSDGFLLFGTTDNPVLYVVYLFLSVLCKIAVPLFFMISGALLIPKDEDLKTLYKRRVLRLVVALVLFSLAWYVRDLLADGTGFHPRELVRIMYTSTSIHGSYWYLYSYLAILVMLPFIRRLARAMTNREFVYLVGLQILLTGLLPILEYLVHVKSIFLTIPLVTVNIFFFVSGYFLEHRLADKFEGKKRLWIAVALSLACILLTGIITSVRLWQTGDTSSTALQVFHNGLIALPTFTAYVLMKKWFAGVGLGRRAVSTLVWFGGTVFGVYLIEGMLRYGLRFIFTDLQPYLHTFLACIVWIFVSFVASVAIVGILKQVPLLRKIL